MELLDMRKELILNIAKNTALEGLTAQVVLALDFSGSMEHLYTNGKVQELVERILPLGLAFDDNDEVDFYLFHNGSIKLPENITRTNLNGYIRSKVLNKYSMGGTNYAPIINTIVTAYTGWVPATTAPEKKGFFSKLFGGNEEEKKSSVIENLTKPLENPVYVIFITDGENIDKEAAEEAIRNASRYGIFFQFVGIGNERFQFLQKLDDLSGRRIDNANFCKINDVSSKSDEELYKLLLTEFPGWIPQAKAQNQII